MVKLIAPAGKVLRDIRNNAMHSEVICSERNVRWFVVDDGDPIIEPEPVPGVTLGDRVADLEDAVIELAEIISEVTG